MNSLISFDQWLFGLINLDGSNVVFDWLMPAITDLHRDPRALFLILPLMLFWIWRKRLEAGQWLLLVILSVAMSDMISYRVIKSVVQRPRPSEAGLQVQLRTHLHSGTSFPSNHSANVFGAATALSYAFPVAAPVFFAIAGTVAYSRVYVGVHFPLDVLAGALLGIFLAVFLRKIMARWLPRTRLAEKPMDPLGTMADAIIRSDADSSRERS